LLVITGKAADNQAMRRRLQFSLQTLLWLMLVAAAFFAGVVTGLNRVIVLEQAYSADAERVKALSEQQRDSIVAEQQARREQMAE
jgi:hypothetical protein